MSNGPGKYSIFNEYIVEWNILVEYMSISAIDDYDNDHNYDDDVLIPQTRGDHR